MLLKITAAQALAQLEQFSAVIDARSESEFALDHVPGALNWPVLSDAERIVVGTEYAQISPFTAKKRGAALVARNIALHIEREVMPLSKDWKPLVYCWRGGTRSGSLALVLEQIGFRVQLLEGGYREYRRAVIAALEELPARFEYRVVCGTTGSGKSRLLQVLREQGAQVLDLEALANHRGSVLGLVPGSVQPGQKQFETRVWDALRHFDASRPVFVESESKKVGDLRVPLRLMERMRQSPCIQLVLPLPARVQLLIDDYDFFVQDTPAFCGRLDALRASRGHEVVNAWQELARAGRTSEVVHDLLVTHYDPIYIQSMQRNFVGVSAPHLELAWDGSSASLEAAAVRAIAAV
jgi:tRNA 2-selenouridine synthase